MTTEEYNEQKQSLLDDIAAFQSVLDDPYATRDELYIAKHGMFRDNNELNKLERTFHGQN